MLALISAVSNGAVHGARKQLAVIYFSYFKPWCNDDAHVFNAKRR